MKKAALFLVCQWFGMLLLTAQLERQFNFDSLKKVAPAMPDNQAKVSAYLDMCQYSWSVNPPEAVEFGKKALAVAEKIKWEQGIANANGVLGLSYGNLADYNLARQYLQKSLAISQKIKDLNGISKALGTLGNIYFFQGQYPEAMDYFIRAVKVAEERGDSLAMVAGLSNIGSVYSDLDKQAEALDYFQRALALNMARAGKRYNAEILSNIAGIYLKQGKTQLAVQYAEKAIAAGVELNDIPTQEGANAIISSAYFEEGRLDLSMKYARLARQMAETTANKIAVGNAHLKYGLIYYSALEKNLLDLQQEWFAGDKRKGLLMAERESDSAIAIFEEASDLFQLIPAYKLKSDVLYKLGDKDGALAFMKKYATAKDSVFNMEKDRKLTQSAMQYEFDKKEALTRAGQEKKDIQQRLIRNAILTGLIAALLFLLVVYRQRNRIASEKKRSEELLLNILPEEVAEELKAKGSADARQIDMVTVLFTDFKGFTQLAELLSPQELVAEIDHCFREFDHIMQRHGVEKIKTIGDAYMAAGGLPVANLTHAEDVVKAALEIQSFMRQYKEQREKAGKKFFEIRIGVHTGPVVAGIVGVKKFAYDIWGDTVNTASRMETSGETGKVNISEATFQLVKDHFNCQYRGKITAKNKGEMDMYFVETA